MSEFRPHIVCVGGGWVAVKLVRSLRPALWAGTAELTVISWDNYVTSHGLVAELAARFSRSSSPLPARRAFRTARSPAGVIPGYGSSRLGHRFLGRLRSGKLP